jgi:hypothetical protein
MECVMPNALLDEIREVAWLASIVTALSALGVGLAAIVWMVV